MPRRKIVGGVEEIEYRLLNIMRREITASGTQHMCALAAIAALAHLYKVELGPGFDSMVARLPIGTRPGPYVPKTVMPDETVTRPLSDEKESLTVEPPSDIFKDLEDNDE